MSKFNHIIAVVAIAAFTSACASDEDLAGSRNVIDAEPVVTALDVAIEGLNDGRDQALFIHQEIAQKQLVLSAIVQDEASGAIEDFNLTEANTRVVDPDTVQFDYEEEIDGTQRFAFEPDGAYQYIRNAESDEGDVEPTFEQKDIDDDQFVYDNEAESAGDKFSIEDEEDYDEGEEEI